MSALHERTDRPYVSGALAGVAAYLLGYLVTYVWQASQVRAQLRGINAVLQLFGGEAIPAWKAVGWLFYNAHFVAFTRPALGGGQVAQNLVASGDAPTLLYAVPVVVLLAAGGVVGARAGTDATDGSDSADAVRVGLRAGLFVVVGYAPLALLGVFGFTVRRGEYAIAPDVVTGVLLAGLVYPLVFGALGGAVGSALVRRE